MMVSLKYAGCRKFYGSVYGMPISRKTEISDADLDNVIAYLRRNSEVN